MRTTTGRAAFGADAVVALGATGPLERSVWATRPIRFWPGGPQGSLGARSGSATVAARDDGEVAEVGEVADGGLGSGGRAARAAARVAVTWAEGAPTGRP